MLGVSLVGAFFFSFWIWRYWLELRLRVLAPVGRGLRFGCVGVSLFVTYLSLLEIWWNTPPLESVDGDRGSETDRPTLDGREHR